MENNVLLRDIIDTWNIIEKYDIDYTICGCYISISESNYNKLLNVAKNKGYIKNLRK